MAVKIADTIKALSNTFPVAECIDIDVNINGTTKRLQKAIDDGEIGGGESTWKGTLEEWEALSTEEKGKYEVVYFTDDYDSSGIGGDLIWKGTRDEWEALSPEEKGKYEVVCFTDDYDGSESDSTWQGTLEEWEALQQEEKGKYEVVYLTNDYDDSILIDDSNISNKTTYSSTKIENSLNNKANVTDLTTHTSDTSIHVTTSDKTKWNTVDNKIDKTNIVDNLTSTDTDKPLSAKQGKVLKGEIDNKANDNEVIKKTDITTTIDSSSTNTQVTSAKAVYDKILDSKKVIAKSFSDVNNADFIECLNSLTLEGDKIYLLGFDNLCTNLPYKAWWEVIITGCFTEKMCIAKNTWKNEYYLGDLIRDGGVMSLRGGWQKICTTMVADVPYTTITTYNDTTNTVAGTGIIEYCVKNGICYVNISGIQVPSSYIPNTTIILSTELPKSKLIQRNNSIDGSYTYNGGVAINDKLMAVMTTSDTYIYSSLSYPVLEY